MKNLTYKCVENSKNTSGESGNHPNGGSGQLSTALKTQLVNLAAGMGCTHFAHHLYMDTNAQLVANYAAYAANYNLNTIEAETQEWVDLIHGAGMKVLHRGSWSGVKGNNNFPYATYGGGNFIPLGTVAGASTEGETTYCGKLWRWMSVNVGASRWVDGDIVAPISEATEYLAIPSELWFNTSAGVQTGFYNFFLTMHLVVNAYAATIGKTLGYLTIINYSEYRSGYLGQILPNDTNHIAIDYYGHYGGYSNGSHVEPADYVADWIAVRAGTYSGKPLFQTEMGGIFGDSWPTLGATPAAYSRRITTYEESVQYQLEFYRAYRDSLVNPGLMDGFNNWGFWSGQNSSIVKYSAGTYSLNYFGQINAAFFAGNGMPRIPVPNSESFDLTWGGRNIAF